MLARGGVKMTKKRKSVTSIYDIYLEEKRKIDELIEQGYQISKVEENLSGAFVDFIRLNEKNEEEKQTLHITTADARIYFSNVVIQQQRAL